MTRRSVRLASLAVVAAAAVALAGCSMFEGDYDPAPMPIPPETDISYGPVPGCSVESPDTDEICAGSQELDIYRSEEDGPNPVAMYIHGGGFVGGDKGRGVNEHFDELLERGWDIVAVNYRLSMNGENRWPAALQDVRRAVRWIKANAEEQDWDPERVAAIGHSAGGNLTGMLATTADEPGLDATDLPVELREHDSSIVAAVTLNSVSDMETYANGFFGETVLDYLGCNDCPELLAAASVQTHVDANSAPYLAFHGADDGIAMPAQGELVQAAYETAGIGDRFRMVVVDDGPEKFRSHEPDIRRFAGDIADFLDEAAEQVGTSA